MESKEDIQNRIKEIEASKKTNENLDSARRTSYRSGTKHKKKMRKNKNNITKGVGSSLKTGEPLDPPKGSPNGQVAN